MLVTDILKPPYFISTEKPYTVYVRGVATQHGTTEQPAVMAFSKEQAEQASFIDGRYTHTPEAVQEATMRYVVETMNSVEELKRENEQLRRYIIRQAKFDALQAASKPQGWHSFLPYELRMLFLK